MGYAEFLSPTFLWQGLQNTVRPSTKQNIKISNIKQVEMFHMTSNLFVRLAGFSGATAVAMGAYGSHAFFTRKDVSDELKDVYRTANYYHFLHTMALVAVPLTKHPLLVGSLIATGMTVFCGTCYYYALTDYKPIRKFTPYGGTILIVGWLSMML